MSEQLKESAEERVNRKSRWIEVVGELQRIATSRGVPPLNACGDVDEIEYLSKRLQSFRRLDLRGELPSPHPVAGGEWISPDDLLDKLAFAMMSVELERHMHRNLDDALHVPSEVKRTYNRMIASGEAQKMLDALTKAGVVLKPAPPNGGTE